MAARNRARGGQDKNDDSTELNIWQRLQVEAKQVDSLAVGPTVYYKNS